MCVCVCRVCTCVCVCVNDCTNGVISSQSLYCSHAVCSTSIGTAMLVLLFNQTFQNCDYVVAIKSVTYLIISSYCIMFPLGSSTILVLSIPFYITFVEVQKGQYIYLSAALKLHSFLYSKCSPPVSTV